MQSTKEGPEGDKPIGITSLLGLPRPEGYLNRRLNQEAMRWVIISGLKMREIAGSLRFNDDCSFSRFSQKNNGIWMLRYRKLLSGPRSDSKNGE